MKTRNFFTAIALTAAFLFTACNKNNDDNQTEEFRETTLSVDVQLAEGVEAPTSLTIYLFDSDSTARRKDYSDYSTVASDSYNTSAGAYTVVAVANVDDELPTEDKATELGVDGLVDSLIVLKNVYANMLTAYTETTVVADDTQTVTLTLQSGSSGLPGKGTVLVWMNLTNLYTLLYNYGMYIFDSEGNVHYNYYTSGNVPEDFPFYNVPSGPATVVYMCNAVSSGFPTADEAKEMGISALAEYLLTLDDYNNYTSKVGGYAELNVEPKIVQYTTIVLEEGTSLLEELID